MNTVGTIRVLEKIDRIGEIVDVEGEQWEVISVWPKGEYVTACQSSEISDSFARFRPYNVEVIN
jgi:hypothetical protein